MDTLVGFSAGKWWRLLRENRFALDGKYRDRWMTVTFRSLLNSRGRRREDRRYGAEVAKTQVQTPLIIVGHFRSGTTLLHNLLALDEQFAFPNLFQVTNPLTMLLWEQHVEEQLSAAEGQGRPMDNVQISFRSPGEDEAALAVLSLRSPRLGWLFPRHEERYERYLTFDGADATEVDAWRAAFKLFAQKLTWRYQKPLLLKSPDHTGRIRLLLEMYPNARIVHIHRDPYRVFQSTRRLYQKAVVHSHLHQSDGVDLDAGILRRYGTMYDAFFRDKANIPEGQFHEIRFADLEQDMVGQIGLLYERLHLPGFAHVESRIQAYAQENSDYQKNIHDTLPDDVRRRVAAAWRRSFEQWGYPIA